MGRTYDARVIEMKDDLAPGGKRAVVESKYIIPNDDAGNAALARIDMGILNEDSLGWRCMGADCSICGEHIYECPHVPGDIYRGNGICEFRFSGITNVLEDSFVFRGGQKDTTQFVPEGADDAAAVVAGAASRLARLVHGDVSWSGLRDLKRDASVDLAALPKQLRAGVAHFSRAAGFGLLCAEPGERSNTQAVVCARDRFQTPQQAARFVREHDFRADKRSTTAKSYVFEQFAKDRAEKDSFEDIGMDEGVMARVCKRAKSEERRRAAESDNPVRRSMSELFD
jgi:hypothetical protein